MIVLLKCFEASDTPHLAGTLCEKTFISSKLADKLLKTAVSKIKPRISVIFKVNLRGAQRFCSVKPWKLKCVCDYFTEWHKVSAGQGVEHTPTVSSVNSSCDSCETETLHILVLVEQQRHTHQIIFLSSHPKGTKSVATVADKESLYFKTSKKQMSGTFQWAGAKSSWDKKFFSGFVLFCWSLFDSFFSLCWVKRSFKDRTIYCVNAKCSNPQKSACYARWGCVSFGHLLL